MRCMYTICTDLTSFQIELNGTLEIERPDAFISNIIFQMFLLYFLIYSRLSVKNGIYACKHVIFE